MNEALTLWLMAHDGARQSLVARGASPPPPRACWRSRAADFVYRSFDTSELLCPRVHASGTDSAMRRSWANPPPRHSNTNCGKTTEFGERTVDMGARYVLGHMCRPSPSVGHAPVRTRMP